MHIHHLQGYIQAIYLVEYSDKLLLLDGCCRADIDVLKDFILNTLQRPLQDLKVIVVTHMHPDHAGAAHRLRTLTGAKIVSANKIDSWYKNFNGVLLHIIDIVLALYVAKRINKPLKNLWYPRKLEPDYKLNDGDLIPFFNEWQVLETPGHTDRDLSVYHADTKQIYVADLTVKLKKKYIPPFPLFHPKKYKASLAKVKALDPSAIYLAHGGKVKPSLEDYEKLLILAPDLPQTPWRAKAKIRKLFQRKKGR